MGAVVGIKDTWGNVFYFYLEVLFDPNITDGEQSGRPKKSTDPVVRRPPPAK